MRFLFALLLAAWALAALGQPSFGNSEPFRAIPTFHSLGLYWAPPEKDAANRAEVEYRVHGVPGAPYKRGLDLWYDGRTPAQGGQEDTEYRGSLVHLEPGTAYDLRLTLVNIDTGAVVRQAVILATETFIPGTQTCPNPTITNRDVHCTKTWSENLTTATVQTINVPAGTKRIVINPTNNATALGEPSDSGTTYTISVPTGRDGYTRITGTTARQIIDNSATSYACIKVNHGVRNVVIADFVIRNCARFGVDFTPAAGSSSNTFTHNIVIDDNEFTGWGHDGYTFGTLSLAYNDGAVHCSYGNDPAAGLPKPRRIVVQRNSFHDPRHPTNYWAQYSTHPHPEGPMAVRLMECGSNNVIRYNDVYAGPTNDHHFKDAFGDNDAPGSDSDVYANRISDVYDDAIQTEGGNRNVRVWGNFIDRSFVAIANAPVVTGPLYVWRNVSNDMVMYNPFATSEGPADRGPFIKGGPQNVGDPNGGRAYYFHNTILQPPSKHGNSYPRGAGFGLNTSGGPPGTYLYNFWSLNNIWQIHVEITDRMSIRAECNTSTRPCISDHDLYNGRLQDAGSGLAGSPAETHGWGDPGGDPGSVPQYATSFKLPSEANEWSGNFSLASGPGRGGAFELFNFNNQYGAPADVGAHQSGTPDMKFGRCAAGGSGCAATPPDAVLGTTGSTTGPAPWEVTFTSTSTQGSAPFQSITLDFGDGSQPLNWLSDNPAHPAPKTHTYQQPRTVPYTAKLTVTTAQGTDIAEINVTVTNSCSAPPTASFTATPQSGTAPLSVAFNASASSAVSPATIAAYNITYGDGDSGPGVTQSHTYTSVGNYIATLIVTDSNGCQSTPATQQILVTDDKPTFRSAASASYGPNILFRAASSAATNGSSLTTNRPTGTAPNDVMIASIGVRPPSTVITAPAGWTLVRRVDNGTQISLAVFRKVAASSEPSAYTWGLTGATYAVGGIQSFANVDTANPIDVEDGQATPTQLTHATPSVTSTVPNGMVVTSHTFATSTTWTPPSGMTEAFDVQFQPVAANLGQSMEGSYVLQAAAGATGAKTATAAGSSGAEGAGATHILALRPTPPALNIARPAGTTADDVMIASIGVRPPSTAITAPAGWTLVSRIDNGTQVSLAVYRKVAGSSEPSSFGWNITGATYAVGGIQSFANVDTANPIDVENGQTTATALTHTAPSVTTTTANAMVVTSHTFATSTTWTPPSGMTEAFDAQFQPVAANLGQSIEGNYVLQPSAGASGAKTATAAGSAGAEGAGATHTLALRPFSGAPPPGGDTVTLMQGLNGYTGTTDTWMRASAPTSNFGSQCCFDVLEENSASGLVRFNIFASEGGPVPDGATITSATLSFYKYTGPQATLKVSRLLKSWTELGTTWNATGSGSNWTSAGANSAGNDYLATPDAQASAAEAPGCNGQDGGAVCWVHFDVTTGVQAFKSGTTNHGWKLAYVSGSPDPAQAKRFNQRNNPNWPSLRPKLTIIYSSP